MSVWVFVWVFVSAGEVIIDNWSTLRNVLKGIKAKKEVPVQGSHTDDMSAAQSPTGDTSIISLPDLLDCVKREPPAGRIGAKRRLRI